MKPPSFRLMRAAVLLCLSACSANFLTESAAAAAGDVDSFNPVSNGTVYCTVLQPDGKILVGGSFSTMGGVARKNLARLNADGSLDAAFNPGADASGGGYVSCITVLNSGKIIVGGGFTVIAGVTRACIARLNADGSFDATYSGITNGSVYCSALEEDDQLVIGGIFTVASGGSRSYIARLHSDGTLDQGFNPGADNVVDALAVQPDGKIIAGGNFTVLGGGTRFGTGRLLSTGSLDSTFNPAAGGEVTALLVQPDGKILLGGPFTAMAGQTRFRIARLNADTSLDTTFNPNIGAPAGQRVHTMALQADGKILVGGNFTNVGATACSGIVRLNTNGTLDTTFNTGANAAVRSIAIQPDGKAVLAGDFGTIGASSIRPGIARVLNDTVSQNLSVVSGTVVRWLRGGASPEASSVIFEVAAQGASTWTPLGSAARIDGGWQLTGAAMPSFGILRARARTSGGFFNGSGGLVEAQLPFTFLSPLQQWKFNQLGDANAPDTGDPDRDGMVNVLEYVLVLPPAEFSTQPLPSSFAYPDGNRLRLFLTRDPARRDVITEVEAAASPSGPWTVIASSANGLPFTGAGYFSGDSNTAGLKTVEVRDVVNLGDAPRRFLRIRASR